MRTKQAGRPRTTIAIDKAVADEIRELIPGLKANLSDFAATSMREKLDRIYDGEVLQADSGEFICPKCHSLFSILTELREHRKLEREGSA